MADSAYYTAYQMSMNLDLQMRVAASAQQEFEAAGRVDDPEQWSRERRWRWATQSDWIEAVQAAIVTGVYEWGKQVGVVTDQMILSWVQTELAAEGA